MFTIKYEGRQVAKLLFYTRTICVGNAVLLPAYLFSAPFITIGFIASLVIEFYCTEIGKFKYVLHISFYICMLLMRIVISE